MNFIKTDSYISVFLANGESFTVYNDGDSPFDAVVTAVRNKEWDLAYRLANPAVEVAEKLEHTAYGNDVKLENGEITYKGTAIHNTLTDRIIGMLKEGFDVGPMVRFLENLLQNPSYRAVNELYGFMEVGKLPITEDGHFLAYKRIRDNWKDCHSNSIDNSIGQKPSMPRWLVDDQSDNTCSSGLHFCSREYIAHFHGARLVVVKINPRDVVSIPTDYNNTKGRCCEYEVIREIESEYRLEGDLYLDNPESEDVERLPDGPVTDQPLNATSVGSISTDSAFNAIVAIDTKTDQKEAFSDVFTASADLGIPVAYIKRVLRGDRASTNGYSFKYATAEFTADTDIV